MGRCRRVAGGLRDSRERERVPVLSLETETVRIPGVGFHRPLTLRGPGTRWGPSRCCTPSWKPAAGGILRTRKRVNAANQGYTLAGTRGRQCKFYRWAVSLRSSDGDAEALRDAVPSVSRSSSGLLTLVPGGQNAFECRPVEDHTVPMSADGAS